MSEHVPLPTGGIGRVLLENGRRPTAYGKVSCLSTRLVQRAVRGYLPVRRFALALHACFVSPPCVPAACGGNSPQQAGHGAGTRGKDCAHASCSLVYCGAQGAWRMQAERALFSLVSSCAYAVSFGLPEDSRIPMHAWAIESPRNETPQRCRGKLEPNNVLSAAGTCHVINGLRQTMTYTLSSLARHPDAHPAGRQSLLTTTVDGD